MSKKHLTNSVTVVYIVPASHGKFESMLGLGETGTWNADFQGWPALKTLRSWDPEFCIFYVVHTMQH